MGNTYISNEIQYIKDNTSKIPKCLVIMSAYNGEKYIRNQVNSILEQTDVNVTLLVRNDGSKDNTQIILQEIASQNKGKVIVLEKENVGIHKSFTKAFAYAEQLGMFDYVAFSDQDDIWDLDKLCTAIFCLKKYKADFYSCASRLVDSDLNLLHKTTSNIEKARFYMEGNSKVLSSGAQGCTIVITWNIYQFFLKRIMPSLYGHDTWIPIVSYYLFNCIYDANSHMSYRQHNDSWTGNRSNNIRQFFTESRFFFMGLSRYKALSNDILECFADVLSEQDKLTLEAISGKGLQIIGRLKALYKYRFGKYGWKENLVYKFYYVLGI